jgi:hypothetical protein
MSWMFYCVCESLAEVNIKTLACRDVTSCSSADSLQIFKKPVVLKLEAVDSSEPLVPTYQNYTALYHSKLTF